MDFMSDRLFDGRPFRILTVVDCHTREALSLTPRANFRAFQVTEALDALVKLRGRPKSLRVDNGPACGSTTSYLARKDGWPGNRSPSANMRPRYVCRQRRSRRLLPIRKNSRP